MNSQATWETLWEDDADSEAVSEFDAFNDNALLQAVLGRVESKRGNTEHGADSNLRELRPNRSASRASDLPRQQSRRNDLIEQSERIRRECNDLVRLYEKAIGDGRAREAEPRREPAQSQPAPTARRERQAAKDPNWRKKAILMLMIEELL